MVGAVDDDDEWVCAPSKKISGSKVTLGNRGALTPEVHLKRLHRQTVAEDPHGGGVRQVVHARDQHPGALDLG